MARSAKGPDEIQKTYLNPGKAGSDAKRGVTAKKGEGPAKPTQGSSTASARSGKRGVISVPRSRPLPRKSGPSLRLEPTPKGGTTVVPTPAAPATPTKIDKKAARLAQIRALAQREQQPAPAPAKEHPRQRPREGRFLRRSGCPRVGSRGRRPCRGIAHQRRDGTRGNHRPRAARDRDCRARSEHAPTSTGDRAGGDRGRQRRTQGAACRRDPGSRRKHQPRPACDRDPRTRGNRHGGAACVRDAGGRNKHRPRAARDHGDTGGRGGRRKSSDPIGPSGTAPHHAGRPARDDAPPDPARDARAPEEDRARVVAALEARPARRNLAQHSERPAPRGLVAGTILAAYDSLQPGWFRDSPASRRPPGRSRLLCSTRPAV